MKCSTSFTCSFRLTQRCDRLYRRAAIVLKSNIEEISQCILHIKEKNSKEIYLEQRKEPEKAPLPEGKSRSRHPLKIELTSIQPF